MTDTRITPPSDPIIEDDNPLLTEWLADHGADAPYRWMDREYDYGHRRRRRHALTSIYSFAVPTEEALGLIASFGPVVEIGAGTGYWAALLRNRGCDVVAYDLLSDAFDKWFPAGQYGGVEKGDVDKAAEHADRTLLLVWPPYNTPMAYDALNTYREAGGQRLVYVGEGEGGCTGGEDFHEALNGPEWTETDSLLIPQWTDINDWLTIYERSTPTTEGRP